MRYVVFYGGSFFPHQASSQVTASSNAKENGMLNVTLLVSKNVIFLFIDCNSIICVEGIIKRNLQFIIIFRHST